MSEFAELPQCRRGFPDGGKWVNAAFRSLRPVAPGLDAPAEGAGAHAGSGRPRRLAGLERAAGRGDGLPRAAARDRARGNCQSARR